MEPREIADWIRGEALALGFEAVGITTADPPQTWERYRQWLAQGYAGQMRYLHRHLELKRDLAGLMPGVRSVVVVAKNYFTGEAPTDWRVPGGARVSRYAAGQDYHDYVRSDLRRLLRTIQQRVPGCRGRVAVDSAPVLERDLAQRAGVGWIGHNTMLIRVGLGSYFFLGELLLDVPLEPDEPAWNRCGTCRRCLEACPTGALVEPGLLDARRCISYWTVECRGERPPEANESLHGWLFGCDRCQEVCPWNRRAPRTTDPRCQPLPCLADLDVRWLARLGAEEFRRVLGRSALARAGRDALRRNVFWVDTDRSAR